MWIEVPWEIAQKNGLFLVAACFPTVLDELVLPVGRLAQPVEHFVYTEGVGGSNPSPPTSSVDVQGDGRCEAPIVGVLAAWA